MKLITLLLIILVNKCILKTIFKKRNKELPNHLFNNDNNRTAINYDIEFKGMTFVGDKYCPDVPYSSDESLESIKNLQNTGANYIAIVVTEYQDYANSTEIYPLYEGNYTHNDYYIYKTESIEGLRKVINYSKEIGLKVMLKPHIDLSKEPQIDVIWRGNIGENFTNFEWDQWFESYEKFLIKYAYLAAELNVEMFSMSCELIAASKMEFHWRKLIKKVKSIYNGILTDSANHDGEEFEKLWWDELDYIGIDAYYLPIQTTKQTSIEKTMEEDLEKVLINIEKLSLKYNKQIIITEVGFCSGNCLIGKRNFPPTPTDFYMQAYFYETFIKIFSKKSFIKGYFWWAWNSDPNFGGFEDNCISPQHKLTEYVLRNYYRGDISSIKYKANGKAKCLCTI